MKKIILILTLIMLSVCTSKVISEGTAQRMTRFDKIKYQVGYYESRNNHNVKPGDNGKAFGYYQFHKKTFNWMKGLAGMPQLKISSEKDQGKLFEWAIKKGYGRHWSCIKDGRVKEV